MNQLIRIPCPADGSCFFHAILQSSSSDYRAEMVGGNRVPKHRIARQFRDDLARLLEHPINEGGPTWYQYLSRGQLPELSKSLPDLSLSGLQTKLTSGEPIGSEFHELVSDVLNRDIYIVDGNTNQLYNIGDDELLYNFRLSILLYYKHGHYDLLGRQTGSGEIQTVFEPNDPLIVELKE